MSQGMVSYYFDHKITDALSGKEYSSVLKKNSCVQDILDHLKYQSKVICWCHGALPSLVSSTSELSLHRSLVLSKSHYIIIHCNKIFKTALQVQMFLHPLSDMLQLVVVVVVVVVVVGGKKKQEEEDTGNEVVCFWLPAVVEFVHQGMNDGYNMYGCRWQIVA